MPASTLMQPVLTADAMRGADRYTIDTFGIPGFTLMETAGRAAADQIERRYGPVAGRTVACFCGKGNNGGDGLVVARVLHARGARVRVFTLAEADDMSEDAGRNLRLLERLADEDGARLTLALFEDLHQVAAYRPADLHVDALLGTGLTSDLRAPIEGLVDWLNEQPQPLIALDVPTGLHSDTGEILGTAARADLTVTMGALKAGLCIGDGPRVSGRVEVAEIGIPAFVLGRAADEEEGCGRLTNDAAVAAWLPGRAPDAHKYSVGMALLVAGSKGLTGAPVMASSAAARVGAGAVVCATHEDVQEVLAMKMTEVMTMSLPGTERGGLDPDSLDALQLRLEKARAVLVGPGLGAHPDTQRFVRHLLEHVDVPVVIDADGLNALAGFGDFIAKHARGKWILTPHAGEFRRLAGKDADLTDRIRTAQAYASRWNCVLILKGMPSIVATPGGATYLNATGGPALATAGTGDVLAGMAVGLLAQGLSPERAAVCALHLGGAAADHYAATRDARTMLAMDLLDHLPDVYRERFGGN